MNSSTLLVSLDGIQVESFQEVVQARGIDRVIVVTDSTAFSDSEISATVSASSAVKNYVPTVEFALNSGNALTISESALKSIRSEGLTFVNDPGLGTIEGSLIAETSLLNSEGTSAEFYVFNSDTNTSDQLLLQDGLSIDKDNFAKKLSVNMTGPTPSFLSDLSSTIQVNITAEEFSDIVINEQSELDVTDYSNLNIAGPESLPERVRGINVSVNGGRSGFKEFLDPDEVVAAGITYYGNLTSVSGRESEVSRNGNTYMWSASGDINVKQMLALPMGVASQDGQTIRLVDTAENIFVILPRLTNAQLASVNQL